MEHLITANVATSLYWLGRYIERIESSLVHIIAAYDKIIDVKKDAGVELYKKFNIDIEYTDALDFLHVAILGDHTANLTTISGFARENATISRNHINTEIFGEIIALHALFQNLSKSKIDIDYKVVDNAQSLISEIWGELSKRKHKKFSDYFIKLGKVVEETDFCFRFNENETHTNNVINDVYTVLEILSTGDKPDRTYLQTKMGHQEVMDAIHQQIQSVIIE
ncbi:alpha-E domain-containing protein [bacterium]|nr:alpha-E domain-containing protein [bacterium]MBU1884782.1 alpha-E domain-containing protein [bacterium]